MKPLFILLLDKEGRQKAYLIKTEAERISVLSGLPLHTLQDLHVTFPQVVGGFVASSHFLAFTFIHWIINQRGQPRDASLAEVQSFCQLQLFWDTVQSYVICML